MSAKNFRPSRANSGNRRGRDAVSDLLLSSDDLDACRSDSKQVINRGARWVDEPGRHRQRNFGAEAADGAVRRIYLRENLDDNRDCSCGLALVQKGGRPLSLARYNGASHVHREIRYRCHIHRATAEAIFAGTKIDSHAEETDRYSTLKGAPACLIDDCCVRGLASNHELPDLFDDA